MRRRFQISIVLFLVISLWISEITAGSTIFEAQKLAPEEIILRKFAMFNSQDAPAKTWPGNGRSFIYTNIQVTGAHDNKIHFINIHSDAIGYLGLRVADKKSVYYCCTNLISQNTDIPALRNCAVGDLILNYDYVNVSENVLDHSIAELSNNFTVIKTHNITQTGLWYNYIINCGTKAASPAVAINGELEFMNPFGNLNGEWWYNMPFFLSLMLVYILVLFYWIGVSLYHRKQLLKLQNWIGLVILCGVIETAALYFAYLGFNNIGKNYIGAMIVGTLVSSLKKTLSRVLILVVCMGYGVVKPTLGTESYRVLLIGFFYFLFSSASYVTALVHKSGNIAVSESWTLLLVIPTAILDTWFYWWTLTALIRTITLLQERKQHIKLSMYKRFFVTLIGLGCSLIIVVLSETIVTFATTEDQTWKVTWIWGAFFEILYFVMLVTVAIIWRPISNNTRYAYNEVESDGGDVEQVMLSNLNTVSQRKPNRDKEDDNDESKASFTIDEDHA